MGRPKKQDSVWLEPRGGTRYRVRYRVPGDPLPKTAGIFPNKTLANEEKRRVQASLRTTPKHRGDLMPLRALGRLYGEEAVQDGRMREGTAYDYRRAIELACDRMGWQTVVDLTPSAVDEFRREHSATSGWRILRAVARWAAWRFDQPVDPRLIARPPAMRRQAAVRAPTLIPDKLVKQAAKTAAELGPHAEAMIHLCATYGRRPITWVHVEIGHCHLASRRPSIELHHHKTNKKDCDVLDVPPRTAKLLKACAKGRTKGERLLLDPRDNEPWDLAKNGTAKAVADWYWQWISRDFPDPFKGIYCLKDWAISKLCESLPDHRVIAICGTKSIARYKKRATDDRSDLQHLPRL